MQKPRDLAFDKLPPRQQAVITYSSPLSPDEAAMVITAKGFNVLQLQSEETRATVINPSDEEVPYFFAIVPKKLLAILNADWKALAAFVRSLQSNLLH